ncbi:hypothetical protein SLEP1_g869 [Rubroshorea leprosula]|uniref:Uncharacterized protein n=1 Tax=Rubroshorea leprosula TaxID=152421 RepID=A0AAV5HBZ6_9ROSI|nr:hypothetical protein SLEP1_g869 [Rubroshorea leprosula]
MRKFHLFSFFFSNPFTVVVLLDEFMYASWLPMGSKL